MVVVLIWAALRLAVLSLIDHKPQKDSDGKNLAKIWADVAEKLAQEQAQLQEPLKSRPPKNGTEKEKEFPLGFSPQNYLLRARLLADPELQNNKCDFYNNADFLFDPKAHPSAVCGVRESMADKWAFGLDMEGDSKSYLDKKVGLGARGFYKSVLLHLQGKLTGYIDTNKEAKEFLDEEIEDVQLEKEDQDLDSTGFLWKKSSAPIKPSSSATASRIKCGILDTQIPQRYCETRNIAFKLDWIPAVSEQEKGLDLLPSFGTMETMCHLNENSWFGRGFGGGAAGWMFDGMEILNPKESDDIKCDIWLNTPLFFISRWDTTNPYQFHQDAMNTFLVYSMLNLTTDNIQPVLLDRRKADGPYTAAWSHIFTSSRRLVDIRQLSEAAMRQLTGWAGNSSPNLCVRRAIWGIHGGISPMSRGGNKKSECIGSPLFQAFREFMLDRAKYWDSSQKAFRGIVAAGQNVPTWLPLPVQTKRYGIMFEETVRKLYLDGLQEGNGETDIVKIKQAKSLAEKTIVVTYAIRRSATHHGSPDAGGVFGAQLHGVDDVKPPSDYVQGIEPNLKRLVENESKLIECLETFVKGWKKELNEENPGMNVEFRTVDFAAVSFDDQMAIAHTTDVFVGPHGASFAWILYLRRLPVAGVLELKPPERGAGNQQFQNMAKRFGYG
ncbi:UNVERIFIED_CONTAM: hypothetical protein HDU68_010519 [Siphonaria sp. JEL0065]|nr:hypothetical protein HDU68_010519 [Siphonaria sp. JEL0065]